MQLRLLPFSARPIFALIFWGACASWILPKVVAWRVKRSTDSSMARDQGSLNLVAVLWWSGIAMDFSLSLLVPQAAISWKRTSFFFVGICFMLLGIALRWYSTVIACSPASPTNYFREALPRTCRLDLRRSELCFTRAPWSDWKRSVGLMAYMTQCYGDVTWNTP